MGRYDFLRGKSATFLRDNGLVPQTAEDKAEELRLHSTARSLSTIWKDKDDEPKVLAWDDEFEAYLDHRRKLIKLGGFKNYLPWNIYKAAGYKWVNGFALDQSSAGSCAGAAHRNGLMASDLVSCKLADKVPVEIGVDINYAMARGEGRLDWGDGLNGTPLVKYATTLGNYWTSDLGKYDPRGSNVTQANMNNPEYKKHALSRQSICVYLPDLSFDTYVKACSAGFAVWIGSSAFPSRARKNAKGFSEPSAYARGGHATIFSYSVNFEEDWLLWWQNSHGAAYADGANDIFGCPETGTWISRANLPKFEINANYGKPFIVMGELPNL